MLKGESDLTGSSLAAPELMPEVKTQTDLLPELVPQLAKNLNYIECPEAYPIFSAS